MAKGKSVGAIITDPEGRYLVQYRLQHPVGLAMPAGHVDEGESPEKALRRELFEETGLVAVYEKLLFHKFIPGDCAKCHGGHECWAYYVIVTGEPRLMEPEKHKFVKFMALSEIREYAKHHASDPENYPCDPNWFQYILPALDLL